MSVRTCIVSFGQSKVGLITVGFTLLNDVGQVVYPRSTTGVYEVGGGIYGVAVEFSQDFTGAIKWDTGESPPVYAAEPINSLEAGFSGDLVSTDPQKVVNRI